MALKEIKKPIIDKKNLREIALEESKEDSNSFEIDNAIVNYGIFEGGTYLEIKINESVINKISFQLSKVGEISSSDVSFDNINLTGTVFSKSYFLRCTFSKCRLQGTQFGDATVKDVSVQTSKCADVSFRFGKLKNVHFSECDLSDADFLGSSLENVTFENCILKNTQFSQTSFKNVSFRGSQIEGIAIDKESYTSLTVNTGQAIYLASLLGLNVED